MTSSSTPETCDMISYSTGCFFALLSISFFPRRQRVVLRDALVALLADQRRKFMSGGELCVETVLRALLELREASLEVIDAITRYNVHVCTCLLETYVVLEAFCCWPM